LNNMIFGVKMYSLCVLDGSFIAANLLLVLNFLDIINNRQIIRDMIIIKVQVLILFLSITFQRKCKQKNLN